MRSNRALVALEKARCLLMAVLLLCLIEFPSIRFANAATVLPAMSSRPAPSRRREFNGIFESGSVSNERRRSAGEQLLIHAELAVLVLQVVGADVSLADLAGAVAVRQRHPRIRILRSSLPSRRSIRTVNATSFPLRRAGPCRSCPSISQRGNKGQEVVFDSTGKIHDVIRPAVGPNGKLLARDKAGQPVEIERVQAARDGKPILLDRANKQIDVPGDARVALPWCSATGVRRSACGRTRCW